MQQEKALRDRLGCQMSILTESHELVAGDYTFFRKTARHKGLAEVEAREGEDGFLLGVSLGGHHRRSIRSGRSERAFRFGIDSISLRDLSRPYRAVQGGTFDFALIQIPSAHLAAAEDEGRDTGGHPPDCEQGTRDATVGHLLRAVLPVISGREPAERIFLDQIGHALRYHLRRRYGGAGEPRLARTTAGRVTRRAQDMLAARLDGSVTMDDIARDCGVSRSHLFTVFRRETGCTPHDWLLRLRVARAQDLLRDTTLPLSEVALACGFADQSHFTRVFSRASGISPGRYRSAHAG